MKLIGANLGEVEGEYKLLSEHNFFEDERQEIIKRLERMYFDIVEESKQIEIKPLSQKDGKVEIVQGMINHRCTNDINSLRMISQNGILASEWFGIEESENEGVFCTFVSKVHSEDSEDDFNRIQAKALNIRRLKTGYYNVILFLDNTNPVMEKLLHLDYFEYEKIKQQEPENIEKIYTKEEIELFDKIIEPDSPGGRNFHIKGVVPFCDWSAIPGGIPATLVNGICTKNVQYDQEYIDEIAELFPNATIFNGELEIIKNPIKEIKVQELRNDTLEEEENIEWLDEIQQEISRQEKEVGKENTQMKEDV